MATTASTAAASRQPPPKDSPPGRPDVENIMAGIRRTARERAEEGGKTEREFKADLRKRMLQPFTAHGFSDDFVERVRSRDQARWNIGLSARRLRASPSAPMRMLRWMFWPLTRVLVNVQSAAEQVGRQAEINEYHRRLLWAANRDLELARLELNLIKRELRRLGVYADFSFRRGPDGSPRSSSPARGRSDGRSGRSDRGRGNGRRDGGRADRERGAGRDRQGWRGPRGGRSGDRSGGSGGEVAVRLAFVTPRFLGGGRHAARASRRRTRAAGPGSLANHRSQHHGGRVPVEGAVSGRADPGGRRFACADSPRSHRRPRGAAVRHLRGLLRHLAERRGDYDLIVLFGSLPPALSGGGPDRSRTDGAASLCRRRGGRSGARRGLRPSRGLHLRERGGRGPGSEALRRPSPHAGNRDRRCHVAAGRRRRRVPQARRDCRALPGSGGAAGAGPRSRGIPSFLLHLQGQAPGRSARSGSVRAGFHQHPAAAGPSGARLAERSGTARRHRRARWWSSSRRVLRDSRRPRPSPSRSASRSSSTPRPPGSWTTARRRTAASTTQNYDELELILELGARDPRLFGRMGAAGREFLAARNDWDALMSSYDRAFRSFARPPASVAPSDSRRQGAGKPRGTRGPPTRRPSSSRRPPISGRRRERLPHRPNRPLPMRPRMAPTPPGKIRVRRPRRRGPRTGRSRASSSPRSGTDRGPPPKPRLRPGTVLPGPPARPRSGPGDLREVSGRRARGARVHHLCRSPTGDLREVSGRGPLSETAPLSPSGRRSVAGSVRSGPGGARCEDRDPEPHHLRPSMRQDRHPRATPRRPRWTRAAIRQPRRRDLSSTGRMAALDQDAEAFLGGAAGSFLDRADGGSLPDGNHGAARLPSMTESGPFPSRSDIPSRQRPGGRHPPRAYSLAAAWESWRGTLRRASRAMSASTGRPGSSTRMMRASTRSNRSGS